MIDRRRFLKGAGGLVAGLPLLASLDARAQTAFPRRMLVYFTPNGSRPDAWFPVRGASGAEDDFSLGEIHQPLAPFRDHLLLFQGIHMEAPDRGPGEPHQQGMGALLTGRRLQQGTFVGGDGSLAGWGDGISVDQVIANAVGGQTRIPSLQLGVRATGAAVRHRLSYAGPARPLPPQNDPRDVWSTIFRGFNVPPDEAAIRHEKRSSVLDAVKGQFAAVRRRVSTEDRLKLDAHLAMVRDIEQRLRIDLPPPSVCEVPGAPPQLDSTHEDQMGVVARLQADLLVMAFACDLTRVASLQNSSGANNIRFSFMQSYTDDHQLSHAGNGDTTSRAEWVGRQTWYAQQLAYILGRLQQIPEGAGTMLDNTVVFWGSEIAVGNTHSHRNMPFLLAGRCGGAFRTGRFLTMPDRQHNDLLVSLMNAMGVPGDTFGDPEYCAGPLPNLG
jgi:hypothetical protein